MSERRHSQEHPSSVPSGNVVFHQHQFPTPSKDSPTLDHTGGMNSSFHQRQNHHEPAPLMRDGLTSSFSNNNSSSNNMNMIGVGSHTTGQSPVVILEQRNQINALQAQLQKANLEIDKLRQVINELQQEKSNSQANSPSPSSSSSGQPSANTTPSASFHSPFFRSSSQPPFSSNPDCAPPSSSSSNSKISQTRYWTTEEHMKFLEGLEIYGPKDVKAIASHVGTRNPTQVRTHAQKYFLRLDRERKKGDDPKGCISSSSFSDDSNSSCGSSTSASSNPSAAPSDPSSFSQFSDRNLLSSDEFSKFQEGYNASSHITDFDQRCEFLMEHFLQSRTIDEVKSWVFVYQQTLQQLHSHESVGAKRPRSMSSFEKIKGAINGTNEPLRMSLPNIVPKAYSFTTGQFPPAPFSGNPGFSMPYAAPDQKFVPANRAYPNPSYPTSQSYVPSRSSQLAQQTSYFAPLNAPGPTGFQVFPASFNRPHSLPGMSSSSSSSSSSSFFDGRPDRANSDLDVPIKHNSDGSEFENSDGHHSSNLMHNGTNNSSAFVSSPASSDQTMGNNQQGGSSGLGSSGNGINMQQMGFQSSEMHNGNNFANVSAGMAENNPILLQILHENDRRQRRSVVIHPNSMSSFHPPPSHPAPQPSAFHPFPNVGWAVDQSANSSPMMQGVVPANGGFFVALPASQGEAPPPPPSSSVSSAGPFYPLGHALNTPPFRNSNEPRGQMSDTRTHLSD